VRLLDIDCQTSGRLVVNVLLQGTLIDQHEREVINSETFESFHRFLMILSGVRIGAPCKVTLTFKTVRDKGATEA
jgi:hypothetical protein